MSSVFFKVVNGNLYPEEEEEIHPYCPEWEIPKRVYSLAKKLTKDDLVNLTILLTNPVKTRQQINFWIDNPMCPQGGSDDQGRDQQSRGREDDGVALRD